MSKAEVAPLAGVVLLPKPLSEIALSSAPSRLARRVAGSGPCK